MDDVSPFATRLTMFLGTRVQNLGTVALPTHVLSSHVTLKQSPKLVSGSRVSDHQEVWTKDNQNMRLFMMSDCEC